MGHRLASFVSRCALVAIAVVALPLLDMMLLGKSGWWGIAVLAVLSIFLLWKLLKRPSEKQSGARAKNAMGRKKKKHPLASVQKRNPSFAHIESYHKMKA